ncbi:TetR/AcrR family transcriptional regulator [Demequina salsinemoris]|uniref:TetR/AcrR family transcriptional regulator n=1 Tax=Demequina salsinemoris TaxID=577470 RepID=UPI000784E16F|nr:TetR/AcrR family transcriptional regulator [Demequina salsinemoris]
MAEHTRRQSRSALRDRLLDAATELFAERGYRSVTLADVAARCDVAEASVQHDFPSVGALATAVLARRDEVSPRRGLVSGLSGRRLLSALCGVVGDNTAERDLVALFAAVSVDAIADDHASHDYFEARYAAVSVWIADAFAEVAAEGGLRDGVEPMRAARQMIALMDGMQIQWLYDPHVDMVDPVRGFLDLQLVEPIEPFTL